MAYDGIEDMGERIDRAASWDDTSLDEDIYETEMIAPVNISTYDGGTNDMIITCADAFTHLGNWILETIKRTMNTNKEHGFYVDSYSNVIGIFEGEESNIKFPRDYIGNRVLKFHTHPPGRFNIGIAAHSTVDVSSMNGEMIGIVCPVPNKPSYTGLFGLVRGVDELDTGPKVRQPFTGTRKIRKHYTNTASVILGRNIKYRGAGIQMYETYDNEIAENTRESIEDIESLMKKDDASYGFTETRINQRQIEEYLND